MDQYQSWGKLLTNFQHHWFIRISLKTRQKGHWSIRISPKIHMLSGPVLRDTARLSQRYPPIARCGVFGVSTWPNGCDTPSPFSKRFPLGEHAKCRCDTPPLRRGISAILARYPENKANGCDTPLCDTISKGYCAIGGLSRTGPLSSYGPMAPKPLWKFWPTPASVHRVLFSAGCLVTRAIGPWKEGFRSYAGSAGYESRSGQQTRGESAPESLRCEQIRASSILPPPHLCCEKLSKGGGVQQLLPSKTLHSSQKILHT